jgi:phosphoribosyl-AMP cyclohydrolase
MAAGRDTGTQLELQFDADGLIPAIISDAQSGAVLMFAYMNRSALEATQSTGLVHLWSRSRRALWKKGETSGETFAVREIRTDCDQDVLLVLAEPQGKGAVCHTGRRTCFYRRVESGALVFTGEEPLFDPASVYGRKG